MAMFVRGAGAASLGIDLPPGMWTGEWIDTTTGVTAGRATISGGGIRQIAVPSSHQSDIALRLVRR
jgi:hypothetical protein